MHIEPATLLANGLSAQRPSNLALQHEPSDKKSYQKGRVLAHAAGIVSMPLVQNLVRFRQAEAHQPACQAAIAPGATEAQVPVPKLGFAASRSNRH